VDHGVVHAQIHAVQFDRGLLDLQLVEGDQAHVLHRTHVLVRHEDVVLLCKREVLVELAYEPLHRLLCLREPVFVVDLLFERFSAVESERQRFGLVVPGICCFVRVLRVFPCSNSLQISTYSRSFSERGSDENVGLFVSKLSGVGFRLVRESHPTLGSD